jgi:ABC-type antimicrobial peptide transport system permease subunit
MAVGASRARIIRQLMTEGLLLAMLGGAAGMLLGMWSSDLLIPSLGPLLPFDIAWKSGPDFTTLAATFPSRARCVRKAVTASSLSSVGCRLPWKRINRQSQ